MVEKKMIEKKWIKKDINGQLAQSLKNELNLSPLLAGILSGRQVDTVTDAKDFLDPKLKNLISPSCFAGMATAVTRIISALEKKEIIGVFGDYDVDGVCSTAVLQQFLLQVGADVAVTLPNRMTEGYGLSKPGVDRLHAQGATLLITADCGILAHEQIDYANGLGFDVIVVDHHTVGETLPTAISVINPKRSDCGSQADYLCAAGVAFFLCAAVRKALRERDYFAKNPEPDLKSLLDLVALATVCDVVPLIKDNRILVKAGIKIIRNESRIGLNALIEACGVDKQKISSTNLGFHLGPRINAAGRLEDATAALRLLSTSDEHLAKQLAQELDANNQDRKSIEERTVEEVCCLIDSDPASGELPALVFHNEEWHPGVVGIIASRIAERYHRPAIIIGHKGKGSGRSIRGIDLHRMVTLSSAGLAGFGGHAHAIGLTLGPAGVKAFTSDLLAVMNEQVAKKIFNKEIFYDAEIKLHDISLGLIEELSALEPFGAKNPYPIVRINSCYVRNLRRLNGGHIKGELENADGYLAFIGFHMDIDDDLADKSLDVLGVLDKNQWQGRVSVQLRLLEYKKSLS